MKLFYAKASPFARKNLVLALELGIDIELVPSVPMENPADLHKANPLGKVPALIDREGQSWFDSAVINQVLLAAANNTDIQRSGQAALAGLQIEALATGVTEAAFWSVMEKKRPDTEPSALWLQRWSRAMDQGLDELESRLSDFDACFDVAAITVAAMLGYLDFRHADRDWRSARPGLARWYEQVAARQSMQDSRPDI